MPTKQLTKMTAVQTVSYRSIQNHQNSAPLHGDELRFYKEMMVDFRSFCGFQLDNSVQPIRYDNHNFRGLTSFGTDRRVVWFGRIVADVKISVRRSPEMFFQ